MNILVKLVLLAGLMNSYQLKKPFLQEENWESFLKVYCDDKSIIRNEEWGWLGQIKTTSIFKYLFLPYEPFSSNKESNDAIFKSIVETAKKNKLDFIKFEPRGDISNEFITSLGAKKVKNYNPKDTLVIDLTQSIDDIKSAMSSSTKNMINK